MNQRYIEEPRLSILVVTYNQESYIRNAMDSIFRQTFEGLIELVIADDASTDNTLAIINEYEGRDPQFRLKYLDKTNNLGITKNYQRGFAACTGEYVAILEGDDYWISPFKLQRQVSFLDTHWECNLCGVNYFVFEENRSHMYPRTSIGFEHRLISAREAIFDHLVSNFSTCMYRKSALDALPDELFNICSYDWIVNICVARNSMMGFLEEPMSVYRLHPNGVWNQLDQVKKLKAQLKLIPAYDTLTNHVFQAEFEALSHCLGRAIAKSQIVHIATGMAQPTVGLLSRLVDYLPPVLLVVARALIPPKLKRFIARILYQGAV